MTLAERRIFYALQILVYRGGGTVAFLKKSSAKNFERPIPTEPLALLGWASKPCGALVQRSVRPFPINQI